MKEGKWAAALLAVLLPGSGIAGELQFGAGLGGSNLRIQADRMRDGIGVKADGISARGTIGYRTDAGLLVEFGILGTVSIDNELLLSGATQKSLGVGWQFQRDKWRLTPKAGFLHSYVDGAGGRHFVEDGQPSERFTDTVPYVEGTVEYRFVPKFGLALYLRHVFEDFGSSQAWGVAFQWIVPMR